MVVYNNWSQSRETGAGKLDSWTSGSLGCVGLVTSRLFASINGLAVSWVKEFSPPSMSTPGLPAWDRLASGKLSEFPDSLGSLSGMRPWWSCREGEQGAAGGGGWGCSDITQSQPRGPRRMSHWDESAMAAGGSHTPTAPPETKSYLGITTKQRRGSLSKGEIQPKKDRKTIHSSCSWWKSNSWITALTRPRFNLLN